MTKERHPPTERVAELFERWVEHDVLHGERLNPAELCRSQPELLEQLREQISKYERLGQLIDPPAELEPGAALLHYRIVEKLGAGGMGEVYLAEDEKLGRRVALKVLPADLSADEEQLERFRREARVVASLNHPNIVTEYSVEEVEGVHFLTMELVEGETLDAATPPQGLTPGRVLEIARPLANALAAAHEQGVVHRDLKPANVMIGRDDRPKILDFGLAKQLKPKSVEIGRGPTELLVTQAGTVMGTVAYMSPEQARGDELDGRSDLFSLGVILYELATGRRPFPGESSAEVLAGLLEHEPTAPSRINPKVPPELERVILKCLEKAPESRYRSAHELEEDLSHLAGPLEGTGGRGARPWLGVTVLLATLAVTWVVATRIAPDPREAATRRTEDPALAVLETRPPSIAVLPFANMSEDAANEYFSDGLSEEILNVLAQIAELKVVGRTSSFQFKGTNQDLRVIGEKLDVFSILEGSVRKAGNQVRITAQLVNAADGFHLWSKTYDRELDDIFAVQDDIARSVAAALEVTLLGGEPDDARRPGVNGQAYNAYLQARHFHKKGGKEAVGRAVIYYERALEIDPGFALASAWRSIARGWQASNGWIPQTGGWSQSRQAAERALALNENLAEAWVALGRIRSSHDWDWTGADAAYRRAEELKPGDSEITRRRAQLASRLGHPDEAVDFSRRAIELDPLNLTAHTGLGFYAYTGGRLDEAEAALEKLLELDPDRRLTHLILGLIHLARSEPEKALAEMERETSPIDRLNGLALAYHALGRGEEADAALAELIEAEADIAAFQIAGVYAFRGEVEQAFAWLERAFAQHDSGLGYLKVDPLLANISSDPRYLDLLKRIGLGG